MNHVSLTWDIVTKDLMTKRYNKVAAVENSVQLECVMLYTAVRVSSIYDAAYSILRGLSVETISPPTSPRPALASTSNLTGSSELLKLNIAIPGVLDATTISHQDLATIGLLNFDSLK
jgi:hypothetical protein